MAIIANPIYDSVFKFLLEDNRVARILLSALLKREVREVQMRRNEYSNLQQTRISIFRIDFSAKVVDDEGKEQLVLIELQKTWLATETLRFRQYLGTHYLDKTNVKEETEGKFGLPIISIYILGHKLGDLQEPVVYVRRHYLDYDDRRIEKGVPDPFIESLTHDSIIVQIPYLKSRARNHLERMLSVFDQDYRISDDDHLLNINEEGMKGDELLLVHRLVLAATRPEVRRDMAVEDEILSEIEARDTTIMMKDKVIEQKNKDIEQKNKDIEQKNKDIEQKNKDIEQKNKDIEQKNKDLEKKDKTIEQLMEQKDSLLRGMVRNLADKGMSVADIASIVSISESEVEKLL